MSYILKRLSAVAAAAALTLSVCNAGAYKNYEIQPAKAVTQSQKYSFDNVEISGGGGFVCGIVYNPTEEGLVYARTDMGGAYIRNKETLEWEPITDWVSPDEWNLLGIESIATDPVDTNKVYIAAGTYTNSWTSMNGYILRSDDYGKTWERTELPFKMGGNMPGRSVGERLMIDPNDNNILYFAARSGNGLWKSTDAGVTWNKVESFKNPGNYVEDPKFEYYADNLGLCFVTFDSAKGKKGEPTKDIYVGVADKENPLYVSHDAGKTWAPVEGQPTAKTFKRHFADALEIGIPHHAIISDDGMLYITYGDRGGPYQCQDGAVYRYNTITGEWKDITPPSGKDWDGSPKYENYYGYAGLTMDAQDQKTLLVTSLQSWWPDNFIYRTKDCGETWDPIWEFGDSYPSRIMKYTMDISKAPWLSFGKKLNADKGGLVEGTDIVDTPAPKLGWMMGDIEINPFDSDEMMYGTGATIYGTHNLTDWDKGENVNIEMMASGIEETAVLDLICPPVDGVELISGVGDICGFVHNDVTVGPDCMMQGPIFTSTTGLDYAGLDPDTIIRVGNIDKEKYEMIRKSVAISRDGGKTWSEVQPNISYSFPASCEEQIAQGGTVAISADGSTYVWSTATEQGVVCNVNSAWKAVDTLPAGANICSDRVNPDVFYAYAKNTFYISNDGGQTFEAVQKDLPDESAKIKAVPGKEGHVWIPGSTTGLTYTTDKGKTIKKADGIDRCDVIGFGKAKDGEDYLAIYMCGETNGKYGVYRSDDMAENWTRINDDEHQYGSINYAITGDLRVYGRVFFGTNGRGVIYGDIAGTQGTDTPKPPVTTTVTTKKPVVTTKKPTVTTAVTTKKPSSTTTPVPDEKIIYGDITGDKVVDLSDLVALSMHLLGDKKLDERQMKAADVMGSGEVGIDGLARLRQYIMKDPITLGPKTN